jgi:hypothetical protein
MNPQLSYTVLLEDPKNPGYNNILIYQDGIECAKMLLKLEIVKEKDKKDKLRINISNVNCSCSELKGTCFRMFMELLVYETLHNTKLFERILSPRTEVALFVSPEGSDDFFAIKKLKNLYSKSGYKNYDPKNAEYMVSTISKIRKVIDGYNPIDNPYNTPHESFDKSSFTRPVKPIDKEFKVYDIEPKRLSYDRGNSQSKRRTKLLVAGGTLSRRRNP